MTLSQGEDKTGFVRSMNFGSRLLSLAHLGHIHFSDLHFLCPYNERNGISL